MSATPVTTFELHFLRAQAALLSNPTLSSEARTAIGHLVQAAWLAAVPGVEIEKATADLVKQQLLEVAGLNGDEGAA